MRTSAWTSDSSVLASAEVTHKLPKRRPSIPATTVCVTVYHGDSMQPEVVHEVELRDRNIKTALVAWSETPDALGRWILAIVYGDHVTLVAVTRSGAHEQVLSDTLTTLEEGKRVTHICRVCCAGAANPHWTWLLEASVASDTASHVTTWYIHDKNGVGATSHMAQTLWMSRTPSRKGAACHELGVQRQRLSWTMTPHIATHDYPMFNPLPAVWAEWPDGTVGMACLEPSTGRVVVSTIKHNTTTITVCETGVTTGEQLWWVAQDVFAVGEQQVDEYRAHVCTVGAEHHKTRCFPGVRHAAPAGAKLAGFDKEGNLTLHVV